MSVVRNLNGLEALQLVLDQGHVDPRGVCINGVPDQLGHSENGLSCLRNLLKMIVLNLYLKGLGAHVIQLTESISADCRTVCTVPSRRSRGG